MNPHRFPAPLIAALPLLLAALACAAPLPGASAPTPTLFLLPTAPEPTVTPPPSPTPPPPVEAGPPALLDLCAVLTPAEVEAVLGGPAQAQPNLDSGVCAYSPLTPPPGTPRTLTFAAAYDGEAKALLLVGVGVIMAFSGDPAAQQTFEALNEQLPQLTLSALLAQALPYYERVGYTVTPEPGVGSEAYWLWYESASLGQVLALQGESYAAVTLTGLPEAEARAAARELTLAALGRLPAAFTVLPGESATPTPLAASPTPEAQPAGPPAVWVTDVARSLLLRIDPATREVVARVEVGVYPSDVAVGGGSVWVTEVLDPASSRLSRIDPAANAITASMPLAGRVWRVEFGHGAIWAAGESGIVRINPATLDAATISPEPATALAITPDAVWVTQKEQNRVLRIDPATNTVSTIVPLEGDPTEIDYGRDYLWVLQPGIGSIARIDPASGEVTATRYPAQNATDLDVGAGGVWVAGGLRTVALFDANTPGATLEVIEVGSYPTGIAVGGGAVWVSGQTEGIVSVVNWLNYAVDAVIPTGGQVERLAIDG